MKMNNNSLQGVESRNRLEVVIFFEVLLPPKRIKLIKFYESCYQQSTYVNSWSWYSTLII